MTVHFLSLKILRSSKLTMQEEYIIAHSTPFLFYCFLRPSNNSFFPRIISVALLLQYTGSCFYFFTPVYTFSLFLSICTVPYYLAQVFFLFLSSLFLPHVLFALFLNHDSHAHQQIGRVTSFNTAIL